MTIRKTVGGGRAKPQEASTGCALVVFALLMLLAFWLWRSAG